MDTETLLFITLSSVTLSVIILVKYFKLVSDVSAIRNNATSDKEEYHVAMDMGDTEKAYYYLQRMYFLQTRRDTLSDEDKEFYSAEFTKMGHGMPDTLNSEI